MTNRQAIIRQLILEAQDLEKLISEADMRLAKAPAGYVRVIKHGKGHQFFHRRTPEDKSGVYIPVSEKKLACALIQKKYDERLRVAAEKQLKTIQDFLNRYDPSSLQQVYQLIAEERKPFVAAAELPDEEYICNWQAEEYEGKDFPEDMPEHYTEKGERVRSKSEVLIANTLNQAGVPYRYEYPLCLDGQVIHPDFTILRVCDRQEIYWEHLGMMDDPEYSDNALGRIKRYEQNGLFPGERLILSVETLRHPINLWEIKRFVEHYCM